ncbi:MAG: protein-methionine-sulfoxide reductase heme-binding subunit MsrQ [Mesorhizobium sp.]|nr:protein-methionine-sulfoxide reductase heme-binding subunit MsrQ [Mesorhizobium sp.]
MASTAKSWWRPASVWALYAAGFAPAVWYFSLGATGQIPGNAVKVFEHLLGIWALRFLLATLAVTPLRDLAGVNLLRYRRALGLLAFWYVVMHFLTYMLLDHRLNMAEIVKDIVERPFITIGMASLVLLLPLAATSNNFSIRRLGQNWQKLHRLIYLIVLGGAVHYVMSVKVYTVEPFIYLGLAFLLVAYRPLRPAIMRWKRGRRQVAAG